MISLRPWSKISGMIVLLGILLMLLVACGGGSVQATPAGGAAAFHTSAKTSDGRFLLQLSVNPNHTGVNTFTVGVQDASSGKPATDVQVRLSTTTLDMDMGTEVVYLQSDGNGSYSASGGLSMSGRWRIGIQLTTSDAALHEATVMLYTSP